MNAKNWNETDGNQHCVLFVKSAYAVLCIFLMLFCPIILWSQTPDAKISFSVSGCTLDVAMEKLFEEHHVNVAFSKSELSEIEIDSYSAKNKSIGQVLSELLKGSGYSFKKIGSQYVIRKREGQPVSPPLEKEKEEEVVLSQQPDTIVVVDTVYQIQNVIHHDTVIKFETVLKHDTMYIVKRFWNQNRKFRANGWFLDLSAAGGNGYFSTSPSKTEYNDLYHLHDSAVSLTPFSNFELSAGGGHRERRFTLGASLSYRSQRYRFTLDREICHGGYFKNDTTEMYYVVHPVTHDTTFYYIVDSTYQPEERIIYNAIDMNGLRYLGLNVYMAFDMIEKTYWRLYLKAGLSGEMLLAASGSVFETEAPFYSKILDAEVPRFKGSSYAGIGAGFKIYKRFEVLPELTLHYYFGSLYRSDYPIRVKQYLWNARVGLYYYF